MNFEWYNNNTLVCCVYIMFFILNKIRVCNRYRLSWRLAQTDYYLNNFLIISMLLKLRHHKTYFRFFFLFYSILNRISVTLKISKMSSLVTWTRIDIFNLFWQHVNAKFIEWTAVTILVSQRNECTCVHICDTSKHIPKQTKNDFELVDWI